MKVVLFDGAGDTGSPDSAAWHAWRAQGIGASDALAIAAEGGLVPRSELPSWVKRAAILLDEKRGILPVDTSTNWAIERGKMGEAKVRRLYEERTGNLVTPIFVESEEKPYIRCSLDGIDLTGKIIVEIKCPGQASHALAANGIVPSYYRPQLAHQAMAVWGVNPASWPEDAEVHYVSGVPEEDEIHVVVVPAKDLADLAKELAIAEGLFWDLVLKGEGGLYGDTFSILAEQYLEADAAAKAAGEALDKIKQQLRDYLGSQGKDRIESDGLTVGYEERVGTIDYGALLKDLDVPAEKIEQYRKPGSKSFIIRPHKPKAKAEEGAVKKASPRKSKAAPVAVEPGPFAALL
jgi:putative phage-type endonuclease